MHDPNENEARPTTIEGADAAALGTAPPPESAPQAAAVESTERLVPGADADARADTHSAKPWSTSLAADHPVAGVANDGGREGDPLLEADHED